MPSFGGETSGHSGDASRHSDSSQRRGERPAREKEEAREDTTSGRGIAGTSGGGGRITLLAIAFASGIWLGRITGALHPAFWFAFAGACLLGTVLILRSRLRPRPGLVRFGHLRNAAFPLFLASMCFLGAGWYVFKHDYTPRNHLARFLDDSSALIHLRGTATTEPNVRDRARGSLAAFSFEAPATYFRMRAEELISPEGEVTPVSGEVLVRVDAMIRHFRAGDAVDVMGSVTPFLPPLNPGGWDVRDYARTLNQAGLLRVPHGELLHVTPAERPVVRERITRFRNALRLQASGWLLADLPREGETERSALLSALLLGERGPDLEGLNQSFRHVGLAHLLAISGLHLGVLAGLVLLVLRAGGNDARWHSIVLILLVLSYLFLIEVRLPVLRAAVMTIAAAIGLLFGRRIRMSGLIALSAVALLFWQPEQLFTPGFQLSFGIVLALFHLTMPLRRRWFGERNQLAGSTPGMVAEWIRDVFTASVVAWLVASPIVMVHFGLFTPLAAVASVLALPVVTLLLALGYLKMVMSILLPSVALLLAAPLALLADVLIAIVVALEALPFSVVRIDAPGVAWVRVVWVIGAIVIIICWVLHQTTLQRRGLWVASLAWFVWLIGPHVPIRPQAAMRIDMLAVGDGSCYVVRSGRDTVLFECGSSTDLNAGNRTILPAFRALGINDIDTIVISHANLDHYSAVLEVTSVYSVDRVIITPQLAHAADMQPEGPAAFLLDELQQRGVPLQQVSAGEERTFGEARWTWLHPREDQQFDRVNDTSMVIAIDVAGRRVLLTGDIQAEAMAGLFSLGDALRADVMELPHHGSFHDMAVEFVELVDPAFALQSTGWSRYSNDRWADVLDDDVTRLITARDGASWIEIDDDGAMMYGSFVSGAPGR